MKKIYLLCLVIFCATSLLAQQDEYHHDHQEFHPCGTPPVKSEWLKEYQRNPQNYRTGADTTLYMPLTIQILGNDDSLGFLSMMKILDGLCKLNDDFAGSNAYLHYYLEGDVRYIPNSAWNSHSQIVQGYNMMMANNVPNTINTYVCSSPAGNAGYNLPSASAVAVARTYFSTTATVWAHEIGHNLSVQHPFLGWEGNSYSYSNPTPTQVVYDYTSFKPIFYNSNDTTILDTAWVELVDGSNCSFAADGFCDTPPDYLAIGGWQCNVNNESSILQKDPNGVDFRSDGTNIMSYASDVCNTGFTPNQIAAMRANIYATKSSYLFNQNPNRDTITAAVVPNYPVQGEIVNYLGVDFNWSSVPGATHYVYQLSFVPTFSVIVEEFVTTDTMVTVGQLINNKNYYWRVKPYNQGYACAPKYSFQFETSDLSLVENIASIDQYRIYPNLISNGQAINIDLVLKNTIDAEVMIIGANGQLIQQETIQLNGGFNQHQVHTSNLAAGMYVLVINTDEGILRDKFVVVE